MTYSLAIHTFSLPSVVRNGRWRGLPREPGRQVTGSGLEISPVDGSQLPESMVDGGLEQVLREHP